MEKFVLTLKIEEEEWEKFKFITPRNINLNDAVVELIIKHNKDNSAKLNKHVGMP